MAPYGAQWDWSGGGQAHLAGSNDIVYSYIFGQMVNEEIKTVTITWADGGTQTMPVKDGYYLAMRAGQIVYRSAEGLDAGGKHVHTEEFFEP